MAISINSIDCIERSADYQWKWKFPQIASHSRLPFSMAHESESVEKQGRQQQAVEVKRKKWKSLTTFTKRCNEFKSATQYAIKVTQTISDRFWIRKNVEPMQDRTKGFRLRRFTLWMLDLLSLYFSQISKWNKFHWFGSVRLFSVRFKDVFFHVCNLELGASNE